jgi:hypothetical protein
MVGHIPRQDPARAHVQNQEDVAHAERCRNRHAEIARQHRARVIPHKCAPGLRSRAAPRCGTQRHIPPHRPRRHPNPKLQEEFRGNPLLPTFDSPRPFQRSAAAAAPAIAVDLEALTCTAKTTGSPCDAIESAYPASDREDATPVNEPRQRDECNPRRVVGTARLHLPLHVQSQLLSHEQILGGEFRMRSSGR